jgi:3-phosphoshikimate 1-carboxyvinyltransferase
MPSLPCADGFEGFSPVSEPLFGSVSVPGSKSESNRALVCAAMANGTSSIMAIASGDDTDRMITGLCKMGANIERRDPDVVVTGPIDTTAQDAVEIDCGLAGTTSRFLTAVAALRAGDTTITGAAPLRKRPMAELHVLLASLGVSVASELNRLPATVRGGHFGRVGKDDALAGSPAFRIEARGDTSSQFVSSIMMIAPYVGGIEIRLPENVVSREYLDVTARVMRAFGASVDVDRRTIGVQATPYRPTDYRVNRDWSSASYVFAAAAIAGGGVTVAGLATGTSQPEEAFLAVLTAMGCEVSFDTTGVTVRRDVDRPLRGVDVDMSTMSDLVPTLAAVAVCGDTPSRIRGVGFIRAKESDRLGDLATELNACGASVEVTTDGLRIDPSPLHGHQVDAHDDHRLAMSLALLSLRTPGVCIGSPDVVSKSWPTFWTDMREGLALT